MTRGTLDKRTVTDSERQGAAREDIGAVLRARFGPRDETFFENRSRVYRSKERADLCGSCGRDIEPGEPVARLRFTLRPGQCYAGNACFDCADVKLKDGTWRWRTFGGAWHLYECPSCSRGVAVRASSASKLPVFALCSERCSKHVHNKRRFPEWTREKICKVCGAAFTATRSDATTCAPACRQKAYRRRRKPATSSVINATGLFKKANGYKLPDGVVYVGRADRFGRWEESDWANPFEIGKDGTREEVIAKYERYLLEERPDLMERLPELRGKVLACWCAPEACHAHVLTRLAG